MAAKQTKDTFANIAFMQVTESAANTLTFAQLNIANNLMNQKAAIIIHRIDLFMSTITNLNSTAEYTDIEFRFVMVLMNRSMR